MTKPKPLKRNRKDTQSDEREQIAEDHARRKAEFLRRDRLRRDRGRRR